MNHTKDHRSQERYPQEIESSMNHAGMKVEVASSTAGPEGVVQPMQTASNEDPNGPPGGSGLTRSESRRNAAVPLPPKSAQRSRSVSNTRLSRTLHQDNGETNRESTTPPGSQPGSPQEISTSTFSSNATPRQNTRPYPSSHTRSSSTGQQVAATASPRIPARSNSRTQAKTSQGSEQVSQNSPQAPVIPARSRSVSRSHSRSNTLTKLDGQEHGGPYNGTPTIAEDQEYSISSELAQEKRQSGERSRRQSVSSNYGQDEIARAPSDPPAPSLSPAVTTTTTSSSSSSATDLQKQVAYVETDHQRTHPSLRKQTSTDTAALYQQHQNQSSNGISQYLESQEGHERDPSEDSQHSAERGRARKQDESSKGGMLAWVRSRSKSKDASRYNQDPPSIPEYNPALLPSRSTSSAGRAKSLPRKPSNQNISAHNGPPTPDGSSLQRGKSIGKHGINPPSFSNNSFSKDASAHHPGSLSASTNMSTTHHDKMVRGMGMGGVPVSPAVLLTPQPSFPTTPVLNQPASSPGGMRNMALAMMKQDGSPSSSELQMQQRHQQLQQLQMQHIQQQQQKLATSGSPQPGTPTSPRHQQMAPHSPLTTAATQVTQRLVATRIYIQTESDFKSVNLAPNTTALDVLHMLQQRGTFGEPGDSRYHDRWTIFEYSKEFLIERPLRDFEVVLDVMKTWEADKDNKMICKSFPARNELSASEVLRLVGPAGQASFVRPHGWVQVELKKGKWAKRYLHINDTAVYHSKDERFTGESMLCMLRNFDVYAVQVPRKKAPTKFGFALKSSDSVHMFETPEDDYIHFVCTDTGESLREWLAGLRAAKGMFMYHANPEVIREGQRRETELSSGSNDARGNLTEEQANEQEPTERTKTTEATTNYPNFAPITPGPTTPISAQSQPDSLVPGHQHTSVSDSKDQDRPLSHSNPSPSHSPSVSTSSTFPSNLDSAPVVQSNKSSAKIIRANPMDKMPPIGANSNGTNSRNPFMAGSLLQQRVEAEKQEIENMKLQLKMREQAGVLGARNVNLTEQHQTGSRGRGLPTSASAACLTTSAPSSQAAVAPQFGGPGTLIEKGEARAAELQRSKSAGTALSRASHSHTQTTTNYSNRSRSKSRGPEDRVPFGNTMVSPHSFGSTPGNIPPLPQGPLLQFADNDAMIQSGSLLARAKSSKQAAASGNTMMSGGYGGNGSGVTRGRQGGVNGGSSSSQLMSQGGRTMIKPLVDLGNVNTGQDATWSGRPTNSNASVKPPGRTKTLVEF
ncbi:hypothetical protein BGX34_010675 [Mortierella sp. NVP85]|nr:hypothetical protein BGX34_010675 [Mortierella sp. NVP85]